MKRISFLLLKNILSTTNVRLYLLFLFATIFTIDVNAQLNALGKAQNTISNAQSIVAQTQHWVSEIDTKTESVKNNDAYKALIDGKSVTFPIGLLPASQDRNYALIINKVFMTPDGMFAEVFLKLPLPNNRSLYFLADKVPYTKSGGFAGDLRLYLLKTDSISFGAGYNIKFTGMEESVDECCYLTFNCKGVKDFSLVGFLNFNPQAIVKDSETKEKLSLSFMIQADRISNFIIQFDNIPTFEFTNLPGFKCSIPKFTLDRSELRNPNDLNLPQWYEDSIKVLTNNQDYDVDAPIWEGIYIPTFAIDIPKSFKEKNPNEVLSIIGESIIIDGNGVTFKSKGIGGNQTKFYEGHIKKWDYHIDSFKVNLIASSLSYADVVGGIVLPISKTTTTNDSRTRVDYRIVLSKAVGDADINYFGRALITNKGKILDVNAFGLAKMTLTDTFDFRFNYHAGQFNPSVVLTGTLKLTPKKKGSGSAAKPIGGMSVEFKNLLISTQAPYISIINQGFLRMDAGSGQTLSNFPISIDDPVFITENNGQRVGIQLPLNIMFQKSGSGSGGGNGFGGSTTFTIWAARNPSTTKWEYDDFDLNRIAINVDQGSFKIKGELNRFENDAIYGTGFCGNISMEVMKGKLKIEASGIFGRKGALVVDTTDAQLSNATGDDLVAYRYWFVDAGVTIPSPIPVSPMVGIAGFNGGLYHNMRLIIPTTSVSNSNDAFCTTQSGLEYVPDNKISCGLLAGIALQSLPTKAVFNGKITFGMEFNNSGGLNMVAFYGDVAFLTHPPDLVNTNQLKELMTLEQGGELTEKKDVIRNEQPKSSNGNVRVKWFTQYQVPNEIFIGDFDVYVDVVNVVKGTGQDNKAGTINVYFSPTDKYVYIGTPSIPVGLDIIDLFEANTYFCAGNILPKPPIAPLPPQFTASPIDYNALETGAGISLGTRISLEGDFTASSDFPMCNEVGVGAKMWLAAGFDIMATQTTQPVYCQGGKERGINNWYATGQVFVTGGFELGVFYDCKLIGNGDFILLGASLSAYVFGQLPKPSYIYGEMEVEFEILSIINGSATINMQFGEKCSSSENNKNLTFIKVITPDSSQTAVPVNQKVDVLFDKPIGTFTFNLPKEDGEGVVPYKAEVDFVSTKLEANGKSIMYDTLWDKSRLKLTLIPKNTFPENTNVKVTVVVAFYYQTASGWQKSNTIEQKVSTFTTAFENDKIEVANIRYAYPMPNMNNYYKMESNTGYVKLYSVPNKPLTLSPGYAFAVSILKGTQLVSKITNVSISKNANDDQFSFTLPNDLLLPNTTYTLRFEKVIAIKQNVSITDPTYSSANATNTIGALSPIQADSLILEYAFTTSIFSSFVEKIASYNQRKVEQNNLYVTHILEQNKNTHQAESLSTLELRGLTIEQVNVLRPLVQTSVNGSLPNVLDQAKNMIQLNDASNSIYVSYNAFLKYQILRQNVLSSGLHCLINAQNNTSCSVGNGVQQVTFPKGNYEYILKYTLPGKGTVTSQVPILLPLTNAIIVQ